MGYLLARLRSWAAHRRAAWWLAAAVLAVVTGMGVDAALTPATCPPGVSSAVPRPPDENRPVPGEPALALDQPEGRLVLVAGDRVDLYAVDDYSPSGHLLVGDARVLIPGDRSVTVAVPVDRVADVAAARRWGEIALALAPTAP